MHVVLFISLIVAFWVFYDSKKHGYSVLKGLSWAIGVFFALIIFLPLYLFFRNKRKRLAAAGKAAEVSPSLTRCFYCRRGYEGNPKICHHCGQTL